MRFAHHDHMVQQVPTDRSDDTFDVSVLPGRPWCNRSIPDAHRKQAFSEDLPVCAVTVPQQIVRGALPREGLHDLTRYPLGCRMVCGGDMNNPLAIMIQNDKTKQKPEADGRDDKQVHCSDAIGMVP